MMRPMNIAMVAALAALAALGSALTPLAGTSQAHDGRGVVIHHETLARPADDGYAPPPPETLGLKPWTLVDHTGREVSEQTWRGKWVVMFFGFAGCREACPLGLERIGQAIDLLGDGGREVQPLFVDLDFAGPDLDGLAQFVSHFHPRLVGLTGNRRQMFHILRDFQIRRELKHGLHGKKETGPRIDHSTYFFVIDPEGRTRSYFHHSLMPTDMAAHLRRHVAAP